MFEALVQENALSSESKVNFILFNTNGSGLKGFIYNRVSYTIANVIKVNKDKFLHAILSHFFIYLLGRGTARSSNQWQ